MRYPFFLLSLSSLPLQANIALSPSSPLFPEEGLFVAKESFATLKTGYYLDYVWKMDLKNHSHLKSAKLKKLTEYGAIDLCLSDLVDLYAFIGTQKNHLEYLQQEKNYTFKDTLHFSFALYASGILNQWGKWQLGTCAFYSSTPSHQGLLTQGNKPATSTSFQQYSWGVSLGFSYDFPPFAPYARLDFEKTKIQLDIENHPHFYPMHPLGLAFGFTSDLTHGLFIDIEARCIQENGARALFGLRF